MGVVINNQQIKILPLVNLSKTAQKILKYLDKEDWEVSVLFCDDEFIAELNKRYLQRAGPTNVISFSQVEEMASFPILESERLLGDVVISVDTAQKEAALTEQSLEAYLGELLLHGILHLIGYDHERGEKEALAMENARLRILTALENEK